MYLLLLVKNYPAFTRGGISESILLKTFFCTASTVTVAILYTKACTDDSFYTLLFSCVASQNIIFKLSYLTKPTEVNQKKKSQCTVIQFYLELVSVLTFTAVGF